MRGSVAISLCRVLTPGFLPTLTDASCPPCLISANKTDVLAIDPSTLETRSILENGGLYSTAHVDKDLLFWVDWQAGTIERANINGSERMTLITDDVPPRGLAVDWIANRLYYCNGRGIRHIMVTDLDVNNNETFLNEPCYAHIAVEPLAGYVR